MKKFNTFMSKLPVMISLIVAAVAVLGLYIGILARPVAYGMTYKSEVEKVGGKSCQSVAKFQTNHKMKVYELEDGKKAEGSEFEAWYMVKDGYLIVDFVNTESFKEFEKVINESLKAGAKLDDISFAKIDAFKLTSEAIGQKGTMKCAATTAFAVYEAVLLVVLVAGAVYSTILFVKKKK